MTYHVSRVACDARHRNPRAIRAAVHHVRLTLKQAASKEQPPNCRQQQRPGHTHRQVKPTQPQCISLLCTTAQHSTPPHCTTINTNQPAPRRYCTIPLLPAEMVPEVMHMYTTRKPRAQAVPQWRAAQEFPSKCSAYTLSPSLPFACCLLLVALLPAQQ